MRTYRYRSFFWPAVLILVGVVALLANTGQIPADRLYNLLTLWPLLLIVFGLELIVRRSLHGVTGDVAAALIIVLAIVGATAYVAASPSPSANQSLDSTADLGSLSAGTVDINAGAAQITVSGNGDLGSSLYKAHINYSGPKPQVNLDRETGELHISQASTFFGFGNQQRFELDLQLNPSIPWKITQNTGAATDTYKLGHVHLSGLELNTGASRDEITLGPPTGTVGVQINGGSLTVRIHRPSGTKASVAVNGGAVNLSFDGRSSHAIGSVSAQDGDLGADYYKIEIDGGACNVTLDSSAASQ